MKMKTKMNVILKKIYTIKHKRSIKRKQKAWKKSAEIQINNFMKRGSTEKVS